MPNYLTCLLRNLVQVKNQQLTSDMEQLSGSKLGKEYNKAFNLYAEYITQNARLDESQAGIKIVERNINSFISADDTTLMAENEEELKSFLMNVKEESEKAGLKLNIEKTKTMASGHIILWQIGGKVEAVSDFSWAPKSHRIVATAMKLKMLAP